MIYDTTRQYVPSAPTFDRCDFQHRESNVRDTGNSWASGCTEEDCTKSTSTQETLPKKSSRSSKKQRWKPKGVGSSSNREGHLNTRSRSQNVSGNKLSMTSHSPGVFCTQSPRDDLYRIQSPHWLDDQLGAALDHKRPWRPSRSGPPTPTHDTSFRVPIYSPGDKKAVKLVLPEYLERRRNAFDQMKRENGREVDDSQLKISQNRENPQKSRVAHDDRNFKFEGIQLEPGLEDQKPRLSPGFQVYFKERNRLLGLEDQDYSDMSDIQKRVVMFNYATIARKDRQPKLDFKDRAEGGAENFGETMKEVQDYLHNRGACLFETYEKMGLFVRDSQQYRASATMERDDFHVETAMANLRQAWMDAFLLDEASTGPAKESELGKSWKGSQNLYLPQGMSISLDKKQISLKMLWAFAKRKKPMINREEKSSIIDSTTARIKDSDTVNLARNNRINSHVRETSNLSGKASAGAQNSLEKESSCADSDALVSRHLDSTPLVQKAEHIHLSRQSGMSATFLVHDEPAYQKDSSLNSQQFDTAPNSQSNCSGFGAPTYSGVVFTDLRATVNTSPWPSSRSSKGLVQPFFDWKKAKSHKKDTQTDSSKMTDVVTTFVTNLKSNENSKVRNMVAVLNRSGDVEDDDEARSEKTAKAVDAASSADETGKCDFDYGYDSQDDLSCALPIKNILTIHDYLALGVTPTPDIFDEVPKGVTVLEPQSSSHQNSIIARNPSLSSSLYSSNQSSLGRVKDSNDTCVIKGQPLVENLVAKPNPIINRMDLPFDITGTPLVTEESVPNDLPQPKFQFASNFQDGDIAVNRASRYCCWPIFCQATDFQDDKEPTHPTNPSKSINSINEQHGLSAEMKIPRNVVGSASSKSFSKSTLTDTQADIPESGSLDKTLTSSSWATTESSSTTIPSVVNEVSERPLTKEDLRQWVNIKILELRKATDSVQSYPNAVNREWTHPNHLREWDSKNLWCAFCQGVCAVCQAPCCAYFGSWKVYRDQALPGAHRVWAYDLLKEIPRWKTVGTDEGTFMDCTSCRKLVCPDCCGVCPRWPCNDRSCKNCKADPWKPCDFHLDD